MFLQRPSTFYCGCRGITDKDHYCHRRCTRIPGRREITPACGNDPGCVWCGTSSSVPEMTDTLRQFVSAPQCAHAQATWYFSKYPMLEF